MRTTYSGSIGTKRKHFQLLGEFTQTNSVPDRGWDVNWAPEPGIKPEARRQPAASRGHVAPTQDSPA